MKKIVSLALAGTVALSAVAFTATGASADGWRRHHRPPPPRPGPSYNAGAALAAGAIMGLAVGSMFAPGPVYAEPVYPPPPPPPYYPGYRPGAYPDYALQAHIRWCMNTYDSYDARSDTWTDYRGVVRVCEGP